MALFRTHDAEITLCQFPEAGVAISLAKTLFGGSAAVQTVNPAMKSQPDLIADVGIEMNFLLIEGKMIIHRRIQAGGHFSEEAAHGRECSTQHGWSKASCTGLSPLRERSPRDSRVCQNNVALIPPLHFCPDFLSAHLPSSGDLSHRYYTFGMNVRAKFIVAIIAVLIASPGYAACNKVTASLDEKHSGKLSKSDCSIKDLIDREDLSKVDVYTLVLETAQTVSVSIKSKQFDAYLYVYDENFSTLFAEEDDSGNSFDVSLESLTLLPGTYQVLVNSSTQGADLGNYALQIAEVGSAGAKDSKIEIVESKQGNKSTGSKTKETRVVKEKKDTGKPVDTKVVKTQVVKKEDSVARDKKQNDTNSTDVKKTAVVSKKVETKKPETKVENKVVKKVDVVKKDDKSKYDERTTALINQLEKVTSLSREAILRIVDSINAREAKQ